MFNKNQTYDITYMFDVSALKEAQEIYSRYQEAERLLANGELEKAALILEKSCDPPSIYHGHYRKLFQVWRKQNKMDLKEKNYDFVIDRVLKAIKYNKEMLLEMADYWGKQNNKKLPAKHFQSYSHLKIMDIKNLLVASEKLDRKDLITLAKKKLTKF